MNITPRLEKEARAQANLQANRIRTAFTKQQIKSWPAIEAMFNIKVPESWASKPFTYINVASPHGSFCSYWVMSVMARLEASVSAPVEVAHKAHIDKAVQTFGEITLHPEQQGVHNGIMDALFGPRGEKAVLFDGATGSGKTPVGLSIICELVKRGVLALPENRFRLHPFMIFCPKGVAEHWRREAERMGLGKLVATKKILIFTDTSFNTNDKSIYMQEEENFITEEVHDVWNPILTPVFTIIDECHRYVNRDTARTKAIVALKKACGDQGKFLCLSATPFEKVNDLFMFTFLCDKDFMGVRVNESSFKYFATLLDATPQKPNREAMKRARNVLASNIVSAPYIKPKFKAVNVVWIVDFENDRARQIYKSAHERLQEARRKAGKNTMFGQFQALVALNDYRYTVEPLRAWALAERAAENYKAGTFATVIGGAFKEVLTTVAYILIDKHHIPREHISVIWGGKKEFRPEDILSQEELNGILGHPDPMSLFKDHSLLRKVRITLRYLQDKHEHMESAEEQSIRHAKMKELRLVGKQSDNTRQLEIDKFQDGTSRICLFTNASGGIGLSLDRSKDFLLPREGLFTPVYSGKEFQQVLGRLVRRQSLSDAIQRICMMAGTVEEYHVAPILDEKLKCIAEITNRNFDCVDLLSRDVDGGLAHIVPRDIAQATKDAELDDTIVDARPDEDDDDDDISENPIIAL